MIGAIVIMIVIIVALMIATIITAVFIMTATVHPHSVIPSISTIPHKTPSPTPSSLPT